MFATGSTLRWNRAQLATMLRLLASFRSVIKEGLTIEYAFNAWVGLLRWF